MTPNPHGDFIKINMEETKMKAGEYFTAQNMKQIKHIAAHGKFVAELRQALLAAIERIEYLEDVRYEGID
jgi:hypothetical protein